MKKSRKNFAFPEDLMIWAEEYVKENNTTMTKLIITLLTDLKKSEEQSHAKQI